MSPLARSSWFSLIGVVVLFSAASPADAQIQYVGSAQSSVFALENDSGDAQVDLYQGLRVRLWPERYANLKFSSYGRVARRGAPVDWDARVYHAYGDWMLRGRTIGLRVGRQFLYQGVINGTMDGAALTVSPAQHLSVRLMAGVDPPRDRSVDVKNWNEGNMLGAYSSFRLARELKFSVSYFQRVREESLVWQQLGAAATGSVANNLYYLAELDYNVESAEYQGVRARVTYLGPRWTITEEFSAQKPRILEDSFFTIFTLVAFRQFRSAATYRLGAYELGLQHRFTQYEEDERANQLVGTFGGRWGAVGLVYQSGFAGDNLGIYADVTYEGLGGVALIARSSIYNLERHSAEFDETTAALSGGLRYRHSRRFMVQAEFQQSLNSLYYDNLRGLFRATYNFDSRRSAWSGGRDG